jgi:sulfate-transporting ATPase
VFTLTAVLVVNLRRGDAGRRLLAVRSNERAAAALGVDVMGTKLFAFGLASAIAGVAGILLAFRYHSIPFANFNVFESINVVAYTVIGGIGFVLGPIRGSLLAPGGLGSLLLAENAPDLVQYLLLFSGIMLIVFLVIAPNGIGYAFSRRWEQVRRRIRPPKSMLVALPDVVRERVTPKALEVRGMTVRFGGVVALDGVDLDVAPGEVVGVIGQNGAGKTTLLEGICGFVRPAAGTVQLGGQSLDSCSPMRRARAGIGRSFQQLELFEDLTVLDNLRIACDPQELRTFFADLVRPRQRALSAEAVTAARDLGIETVLARRSTDLDHGTRRLVAIARAVAAAPSVLLLDEPAAGLASRETTELGSLIRTLADDWGIGVVLIEHDVELVMRTCDRILVLDFGRELASGTPDEVREHEGVVAAYLGEPAAIESIEADVTASTP